MIGIENLKKTYDKHTRHAQEVLHGMSFTLPDTGFVCILGQSGCGKTSLLNAIGGLDRFDSGTIVTENTRITRSRSRKMEKERNANFGYIFQNYYLLSEHSAAYNVYLGMHSMALSRREKMQRVRVALEKVDMLRYRKRPVGQLSGGQQQRIAIARAIAKNPKVIFADEPTGNLDEANTMNICSILKELSKESLVVMVTHEERIAKFFADRIITIDSGYIQSDVTEWERGTMYAGVKGAVYTGEYQETQGRVESVSLRLLTEENAPPLSLVVIQEKDRIVIKTNDPRVVLCSETNASPALIEGKRPLLSGESFQTAPKEKSILSQMPAKGKRGQGLGVGFLLREAKSLVSSRRLGKAGMLLFIMLLSVMLSVSVADIITISHINPEDFINTDSHILKLEFNRGAELPRDEMKFNDYIDQYLLKMQEAGLDFDFTISNARYFTYQDNTVPQLGEQSMKMNFLNYANIRRLDPSTLIAGRMPERYDEIVVDRWLIDKYLGGGSILQNIIPNQEYLLGKRIQSTSRTPFAVTIVGICDSGEPSMYLSTEALYSQTTGGVDVMRFSEFCAITGYEGATPEENQCIVLCDNAGIVHSTMVGKTKNIGQFARAFTIIDAPSDTGHNITAKYVLADRVVEEMFEETVRAYTEIRIWCADKQAVLDFINNQMPEELEGLLDVRYEDRYSESYQEYEAETTIKADARTIVTATVFALSLIMLYLMQRSKINEHMDVVAVYRLLGVPKCNLLFVFAVESIVLTLKYALPTVFLTWLGINMFSRMEAIDFSMVFPLSAAALTLLGILVLRLIFSVLPVLRLLYDPPAKLASQHDF